MKSYSEGFCDICSKASKKLQLDSNSKHVCKACYKDEKPDKFNSRALLYMDKELLEDLKTVSEKIREDIKGSITKLRIREISLYVEDEISNKVFEKYFPNNYKDFDIGFTICAGTQTQQAEYFYKNRLISPQDYWIRPEDYLEIPLITLLEECISQDTSQPKCFEGVQNKLKEILRDNENTK